MTGWRHRLALLREVVATCRASLVTSVTTLVMVAGVCASVLLTNGRTVTAQQQALGVLDAVGTRTIVVSVGVLACATAVAVAVVPAVAASRRDPLTELRVP